MSLSLLMNTKDSYNSQLMQSKVRAGWYYIFLGERGWGPLKTVKLLTNSCYSFSGKSAAEKNIILPIAGLHTFESYEL